MARGKRARPAASRQQFLEPLQTRCAECGVGLWVAYHNTRTVMTLAGLCRLILRIRRCPNAACPRYHQAYRPEEEGAWALPHSEFGLAVIALIGSLRYRERRSVPELHAELQRRGVSIAERSVTHLLHRYEELVALRLTETARLQERLRAHRSGCVRRGRWSWPSMGSNPTSATKCSGCCATCARARCCWHAAY